MVLMSNDNVSDESVLRRGLENASSSLNGASVLSPKWKPRNVSAVRLFPPGCGPIVRSVNLVSQEAEAPSPLVQNDYLANDDGALGTTVGSSSSDVSKSTEDGRVGLKISTLVNKELQNGDNQAVLKEEVSIPVKAMAHVDDEKVLSPTHETHNGGNAIKEAIQKIKFRQRRVSAVRHFPPYCGLNAAEPTEEERIRINGKTSFRTDDKCGERNVILTETTVVQKPQSGESSNESAMANIVGGKYEGGGDRSAEKMVVVKEESNIEVQDGKVQMFEQDITEVDTKPQNDDTAFTGQVSQELVVYTRDNVLKKRCSVNLPDEDSEGNFRDESLQNCETQEIKNISGQVSKVRHEKRVKKRPLDDTKESGFTGERMRFVLGLMASSLDPRGRQEKNSTDIIPSKTNVHASVTPKKSKKKKPREKVAGKASRSTENVAYTGTLDMVVRDEEIFVINTEEQGEESPPSHEPHDVAVTLPPFGPKSSSDARNKVRETRRLFQALCRKLLQGEESKTSEGDESKPIKRVDLAAKTILEEKGKALDRGKKTFGPILGVEVGDEFQYRVELALVGIHWTLQGGIDYVKMGKDVVAVSVVASGGYDNELNKPDCLIYSGSGGVGKDKKVEDQKLERGNLALKNNIFQKVPVRVVRGYKGKATESSDSKSKALTTYIYDGLYTVDKYWQEPGPHGNLVYKFELRRIPGQPELAIREVKSKKFKIREGLCVDDITGGKEVFRICAINTIDDEKPPSFNYITKIIYPNWYRHVPPKGCDCVGRCSDKKCSCAFKNNGEIPYNRNGAIVEAKPLVYECGPSCKCPPSCYNRVTQLGMKIQLEIFKTESRGWGVRSLSSISSGSFICEYIGELLEDVEAEKRTGNDEYLFDIGQNYEDCSLTRDAIMENGGFTIDAANYGNVGRFVNHSCSPNLYAQNVVYDQEDERMPHIMLFAAENIPPLQELTYHYNYAINTVHDSDGNIKMKHCYCGSPECTGRLY